MLKSGGTLAIFWNVPSVKSADDPLHCAMDSIYKHFREEGMFIELKQPIVNNLERYNANVETIKKYGFIDVHYRLYHGTRTLNADDYICLLDTYSDHRVIPMPMKAQFYQEIHKTIHRFGGEITLYDTMDLYLAHKP